MLISCLFQGKLELITGIPVPNQRIQLLNNEEETEPIAYLDDDDKVLGFYSLRDFQVLRVCFHVRPIFIIAHYLLVWVLDHRYESFDFVHWSTY